MLAATTTSAIRTITTTTTTITTTTETETTGTEEEEVTESSEGTTDEMTDSAMTGGRTAAATDGQCPPPLSPLPFLNACHSHVVTFALSST
jgi:hypothetical protein